MVSITSDFNASYAVQAHRVIAQASAQSAERLSTGFRINRASDDASGLIASIRHDSNIRGNEYAIKNLMDARSVLEMRMSYQDSFIEAFQRQKEIWLETQNPGITQTEINILNEEFSKLGRDANDLMIRMSEESWIGRDLGLGSSSALREFTLQVGANANDQVTYNGEPTIFGLMRLNHYHPMNTDITRFERGMASRDIGMAALMKDRNNDAAMINRIDSMISNLHSQSSNLVQANSRIRDTDYAHETARYMAMQAREQVSVMAIKQSHVSSQVALSLLR